MNVFISADIEGIGGVMSRAHQGPDSPDYQRACEWMVQEVNAAVEGALAAGAKRVVVKDSHNNGTNIDLNKLHPAAELISGWGPLGSMVEGLDESFNAFILIGYHARAMTVDGTLAHTWSGNVLEMTINGKPHGEAAWAALYAGHYGVPLAMAAGDDKFAAQVRSELPGGFLTVTTKTGWTPTSARLRPLKQVRDEIRASATKSLANLKALAVYRPTLPITLTLRFRNWENVNACAVVPRVRRLDAQTIEVQAVDAIEAQKYFVTLHRLARS